MSGAIEYRPLLRGTPDADSIRVSNLLTFDWQPDPAAGAWAGPPMAMSSSVPRMASPHG
jgi:hypothetical protein